MASEGKAYQELLELLRKKQEPDSPLSIQQQFYQKTCHFLQANSQCIWCKFTPLAVEMLHLYSLPPNALADAFSEMTEACMWSCSACILAYHEQREPFLKRLAESFEEEALEAFRVILHQRDITRLSLVLEDYIEGRITAGNPKILYGLFEILGYPLCLQDERLNEDFCKVLHSLIAARKMLRVTQLMPGLLILAFHRDQAVRHWAVGVLSGDLEAPKSAWNTELVGLSPFIAKARNELAEDELNRGLACAIYWLPAAALTHDHGWLLQSIPHIGFTSHYNTLLLCAVLHRLTEGVGTLGINNVHDFISRLITNPRLIDLIDKLISATLPAKGILGSSYGETLLIWLDSAYFWASSNRDIALQDIILETMISGVASFKSSSALMYISGLLTRLLLQSTDAQYQRKYIEKILRSISSLMPKPALLDLCKMTIRLDFQILSGSGSFNTISRLLTELSDDRSLFEEVRQHVFPANVEAAVFTSILKGRRDYLDYLARTWPLFVPASPSLSENDFMFLLLVYTFSDIRGPNDYLCDCIKASPTGMATAPSAWFKWVKMVENEPALYLPAACRLTEILDRTLLPVLIPRSGKSPLDSAPNGLYLKLHLVSAITGLLALFSLSQGTASISEAVWNAFYQACEAFVLLVDGSGSLGLDALRQCVRENAGMAKRFKHQTTWFPFFAKHSSVLSPARAKALVPFVRDMLYLAITLKSSLPAADKNLALYLAVFQMDPATQAILRPAVQAYEKELNLNLNVKALELPRTAPVHVPLPAPVRVSSIEDLFLQRLKAESVEEPVRLPPLIAAKPATRLGQLKQEMAKEVAPVVLSRRKTNAAVHHTAKAAVKLDVHGPADSSDHEDVTDFTTSFKDDLSALSNVMTGGRDASGRSVKIIALEDTGVVDLTRAKRSDEDPTGGSVDPTQHVRRLQRYLLDLDLAALDDRSVEGSGARPVPDSFSSSQEYTSVFEPLLFFECRSQLLQARAELDSAACFSVKVLAISSIDGYHEVTVGAESKGSGPDGDAPGRLLSEHDYIVARLDARKAASEISGLVTQASAKGNRTEATVRFRFRPHQQQYQVELRIGLLWKVKRLCNFVTNLREFTALHAIHELRLCRAILDPAQALSSPDGPDVAATARMLERSLEVNPSQAEAIAVALNNPGAFSLIQGPPGTGKTRTILGLVGALFGRPCPGLVSRLRPQRLLICAPSNAAIDEIVRRLRSGILDCYQQRFVPKILRIGSHDMIHEEVRDVTLDAAMERAFNQACKDSLALLQQQRDQVAAAKAELDAAERDGTARAEELQRMRQNLWQLKDAAKRNAGFIEGTRATLRNRVMSEAQVVCATLSASGMDLLSRLQFDVVIIDEACQAVEISALIPLQYGCKYCILVGDPNQLPPTVISQAASIFAYEQSLFQRIQKASPGSVSLLSVQYRMHPAISAFPNRYFYGGRLTDGPGMLEERTRPWHSERRLGPYIFFDIPGQERNQVRRSGEQGTSKSNEAEARACASLVAYLCGVSPDINFSGKIGIVTPYKDQRRTLKREFRRKFGDSSLSAIEISTVDGYQGQEKEVIIFSCVRTSDTGGIGFLTDARRLNVALTRAKASLFILGRADALQRNGLWRELIKDARERSCFIEHDEHFWSWMRERRAPPNAFRSKPAIEPPKKEEPQPPKKDPESFKIKTPMQRRREAMEDSAAVKASQPAAVEPLKKRALLLDSLLERISKEDEHR